MATFGRIGEFNDRNEQWSTYTDRLSEYFTANDIINATKKRAILNSVVGASTYNLISSLLAPKKPGEASYTEIVKLLEKHYEPAKSAIMSRFSFHKRYRNTQESIGDFIAAMRAIAQDCKFANTLEERLRDQLVFGVNYVKIQNTLLAQGDDLTFKKAQELAQSMELAAAHTKVLAGEKEAAAALSSHNVDVVKCKPQQPRSYFNYSQGQGQDNKYHELDRSTGTRPKGKARVNPSASSRVSINACRYCGLMHTAQQCPAYSKECYKCHGFNHFAKCCPSGNSQSVRVAQSHRPRFRQVHVLDTPLESDILYEESYDQYQRDEMPDHIDDEEYLVSDIDTVLGPIKDEIITHAIISGQFRVALKLDTGAKCNVMPRKVFDHVAQSESSIDTSCKATLVAFGGDKIQSDGVCKLKCKIGSQEKFVEFRIVDMNVPVILGLVDCRRFGLITLSHDVSVWQIETEHNVTTHNEVFTNYPELFDESVGALPVKYHMTVDKNVPSVVRPPRRVPVAMQSKVKAELQRMTKLGVIAPITEPTEWVSSMVATHKKDTSDIRLCIDPRDLNRALKRPHHPTRTVEEVATKMEGATIFSVLDAKSSFWQIPLDYESSLLTTFSSPHGRFRYLRMPYGLKSSSDVFQQTMEHLFADVPCSIVVDDIIVCGRDKAEHDRNLKEVLDRARKVNLRLNPRKCKFGVSQVQYVGHIFSSRGLLADPKKVDAIVNMPEPEDVNALSRFLGMVNYLSKFIPNLSEHAAPLRQLKHKDAQWCWLEQHRQAYNKIKAMITSTPNLRFYDVSKPVILTCDASKFGLGCACLQDNGPVAYASRTMKDHEQRYSQIEKEFLAVLFACHKFHDFIYGKHTIVETDHKPLITIMKKPMHLIPARLQRMRLQLQKYDIELVYKKGAELYIADTLSRAPLRDTTQSFDEQDQFVVMTMELRISEPKQAELATATKSDPQLQKVASFIQHGWPDKPSKLPAEVRPFFTFCEDLTISDSGIIMKGLKAVIPQALQPSYTHSLHEGHPGIEATKRRARDIVYWPNMCKDIEHLVSSCPVCNSMKAHLPKEPLQSYPVPTTPFETVGVDLFHWNGNEYLAIGDSYSTWFDFHSLEDITSHTVIKKLKRQFSNHGVPRYLISDNARQFKCAEFTEFARDWNFIHITSSPQYPQSNGLAESAVKRAKQVLEKTKREHSDIYRNLLNLRNVPTSAELGSPAQRLMSRRLRTTVPATPALLKPQVQRHVTQNLQHKRNQQKRTYDRSAHPLKPLKPNQTIRMQTPHGHNKLGVVVRSSGDPRSYVVSADGTQYRRNRRHLLPVAEPPPENQTADDFVFQPPHQNQNREPAREPPAQCFQPDKTVPPPVITRSGRVSKPNPKYYAN